MSGNLILRGRTVVPGAVEGEALVSHEPISGWGGIDPARGVIIERRHELYGVCFTGKILVFPSAKGSSGGPGSSRPRGCQAPRRPGWSSAGSQRNQPWGRW